MTDRQIIIEILRYLTQSHSELGCTLLENLRLIIEELEPDHEHRSLQIAASLPPEKWLAYDPELSSQELEWLEQHRENLIGPRKKKIVS